MSKKKDTSEITEPVYSPQEGLTELTYLVTSQSQLGIYDDYQAVFGYNTAEVAHQREVSIERRIRRKRERALAEKAMAEELMKQKNQDVQARANLQKYGLRIQKHMRAYPYLRKYRHLKEALRERSSRKAYVFGVDEYDDTRIRKGTHNVRSAVDIALSLQALGFTVECYTDGASEERFRPTRANFLRVLEELKANSTDLTLLYIACHGVYAPVQGHNPYRVVAKDGVARTQTPRSRLNTILQRSLNRARNGKDDVKENIVRVIVPMETKTARLSFDAVISLEEITEVLTSGRSILGRMAEQRIVIVDTSYYGNVESSQGVGWGFFGSTVTKDHIWDYALPEGSVQEQAGMLTMALHRAISGYSASHRSGITATGIVSYLEAAMSRYNIPCTTKGRSWGDLVIADNLRVRPLFKNLQRQSPFMDFKADEPDDTNHSDSFQHSASAGFTVRPQPPRMCCMRVLLDIDLEGGSWFDPESSLCEARLIGLLHEVVPAIPRLVMGSFGDSWDLMIGLKATFIDIAKLRRSDQNVWDTLLYDLLGSSVGRVTSLKTGKAHEGGVLLVITTTYVSDISICEDNLHKLPNVLGFAHNTFSVRVAADVFGTTQQLEALDLHARTTSRIVARESTVTVEDEFDVIPSQSQSKAFGSPMLTRDPVVEGSGPQKPEFTGLPSVLLVSARVLLSRINDVCPAIAEGLIRRDKPQLYPTGVQIQPGTALMLTCVAGTPEQRARQIAEAAKVAPTYEPLRGIVFMYMDESPIDVSRAKILRHIVALRAVVPHPSLVLIDNAKKRSYLLKTSQDRKFFPAHFVVHFAEEYVKGALNDLLPPVRGSKVFGCGSTSNKFVLIQT